MYFLHAGVMEKVKVRNGFGLKGEPLHETLAKEVSKATTDNLQKMTDELFKDRWTQKTREAPSLTLKDLQEAKCKLDRYDKVYFMESNFLPDDCLAIVYVRKEDMPKK